LFRDAGLRRAPRHQESEAEFASRHNLTLFLFLAKPRST
jgi:hypothetical protein